MNLKSFLILSILIIIWVIYNIIKYDYTADNEYTKFLLILKVKLTQLKDRNRNYRKCGISFNNNGKKTLAMKTTSSEEKSKIFDIYCYLKGVDKKTNNPALHEKLGLVFRNKKV